MDRQISDVEQERKQERDIELVRGDLQRLRQVQRGLGELIQRLSGGEGEGEELAGIGIHDHIMNHDSGNGYLDCLEAD